jgi:hypothetical protein
MKELPRKMSSLSLANLIYPIAPSEYIEEYWEKDCLVAKITTESVEDVLTVREVESLANSLSQSKPEWLRLIHNNKTIHEDAYSTSEQLVDVAKVAKAYHEGYSIQLARLHKRSAAVGRLCRRIEQDLLALGVSLIDRVGAHAYLTPANSRGLGVHCDYQDVFVIQLDGAKRWKVREWTSRYPIEQTTLDISEDDLPNIRLDTTLEKGDVLYIPRGSVHEAWTEGAFSLHLSLSIYPATYNDLLTTALKGLSSARAPLPVGLNRQTGWLPATKAAISALGLTLFEPSVIEQSMNALQTRSLMRMDPLPGNRLEDLELNTSASELVPDSRLRRSSTPFILMLEGSDVLLKWREGILKGGPQSRSAFEMIASVEEFRISEIPLRSELRLPIAREIVRAGLFAVRTEKDE